MTAEFGSARSKNTILDSREGEAGGLLSGNNIPNSEVVQTILFGHSRLLYLYFCLFKS